MKLLVQSDDYGFTRAVTLGIIDGIDYGILRNTGVFPNMPAAKLAGELAKDRPQACFGIDFNLVAGPSAADPKLIPHLVDENGYLIRSNIRIHDPRWQTEEGRAEMFPYDEVYTELRAQYDKYVELFGHKPGYLHGHSISTENSKKATRQIANEENVVMTTDMFEKFNFYSVIVGGSASKSKVFNPEEQLYKDALGTLLASLEEMEKHEYVLLGGHMGYIDTELLKYTSLSLERMRDLEMVMAPEIIQWVKDKNIQLITYYDLVKELENK